MPKLTQNEMLKKDPHDLFFNDETDEFVENRETLDALEHQDKVYMLTTLLKSCEASDVRDLRNKKEALKPQKTAEKPSFYEYMSDAIGVYEKIYSLTDSRNKTPYEALLSMDCNMQAFNRFSNLACDLVHSKESEIAQRLVQSIPVNSENEPDRQIHNELSRNIGIIFKNSKLPVALQKAQLTSMLLRRLTGENPKEFFFFYDNDTSPDLFHEFDNMVREQLYGKEQEIAEKLAKAAPASHKDILLKLERLSPATGIGQHPIRTIRLEFEKKIGENNKSPLAKQSLFSLQKEEGSETRRRQEEEKDSKCCCIIV